MFGFWNLMLGIWILEFNYMGKIRVKALGNEENEKEQRRKDAIRREKKKALSEGPIETEKPVEEKKPAQKKGDKKIESKKEEKAETTGQVVQKKPKKKFEKKKDIVQGRSSHYQELKKLVDPKKFYQLPEAITIVKSTSKAHFAESVEAHVNLKKTAKELGLKGAVKKKVSAKKKDTKEVEEPKETMKIVYEKKFPIAHVLVGKTSETESELQEKITRLMKLIGTTNITKVTITSTMGPGVKVSI